VSVDFTGSPTSGTQPLEINFSPDIYGDVISAEWDFGDEFVSSEINPTHTYSCPGAYDVFLSATYRRRTPGISVDTSGYIDLTTDADYLNDLRNGSFGVVTVFIPDSNTLDAGSYWDADAEPNYPALVKNDAAAPVITGYFSWPGGASITHEITLNEDVVNDWILAVNSSESWASFNGGTVDNDAGHNTLDAAQSTFIRLGANADDPTSWKAIGSFAFFAVLDLSSVTVDATFGQALADAVNAVEASHCYDPEKIREAIIGVDSNITGVFWKLDEAGTSGSANSLTLTRYKVEDGTVDSTEGGTTSLSGCTGCIISQSDETLSGTKTKINYISAANDDPKLPENDCCFGPYAVTCVGCSSGSGTSFYDSSKTFRSCQNADCVGSCEATFGDIYSIDYDYIDDCPECRECYLTNSSQLGRYYSLTITNCEVYVTNYLAENSCGSCLEQAETFCFAMTGCGDVDEDNPGCSTAFVFDDQFFIVSGEPGACGTSIDCGDCWRTPNAPIEEDFSFLPEELDTCEAKELAVDVDQPIDQEQTTTVDVVWHNQPSNETGSGTGCLTEILIPTDAESSTANESKSFRNPDVDVAPTGHSIVAYEDMARSGITKLSFSEQHTSVKNRVVHYRSLGKGRLINSPLTEDSIVKFHIYDVITTDPDIYANYGIGFKSGPLAGRVYSVDSVIAHPTAEEIPNGSGTLNPTYFTSLFLDLINKKIYGEEFTSSRRLLRLNIDGSDWESLDTAYGSTAIMNFFIDVNNDYIYQLRRKNGSTYVIDRGPIGGTWQPEILTISSSVITCTALDIDTTNSRIYYIKPGEIRRCNTDGTSDELLVTLSDTYAPSIKLEVSNNLMWWTEYNDGKINKANLNGSNATTVIDGFANQPWGLDVAEGKIYWSEYIDKVIKYSDDDGTSVNVLVATEETPRSIRIDANNNTLYWLEGQFNAGLDPPLDVYPNKLKKVTVTSRPYYEIEFLLSNQINNG